LKGARVETLHPNENAIKETPKVKASKKGAGETKGNLMGREENSKGRKGDA